MQERRLGYVQKYLLHDLVTIGHWNSIEFPEGAGRAREVMASLARRWYAHLESGDSWNATAHYVPTGKADEWYLHEGYLWRSRATKPFLVRPLKKRA